MLNSDKVILHLCADIGSDTQPYKDAGYTVLHIGKDVGVENYTPPEDVYGVVANPPCTEFSTARSGYYFGTKEKQERMYEKGLFIFDQCMRIIQECKPTFYLIENPSTGKLKDFIGKPEHTYQPWEYGDPWTKRTGLWGYFNMPDPLYTSWEDVPKNDKLYVRPGRPKPSLAFLHKSAIDYIEPFKQFKDKVVDDMSFRSLCPQGFAKAFFKVNQ